LLKDKLSDAGYGADFVLSVMGGFALEVCKMAKEMAIGSSASFFFTMAREMASGSSARTFYIIDVENIFHGRTYGVVLRQVLNAANVYIQRRWNERGRGRNVTLIIPLFSTKVAIFQRIMREIIDELTSYGRAYAFNVRIIPYSLDFFNNPTVHDPTTEPAAKRRRTGLVDLNNLFIKLRF
jgi:hypothetical protein